MDLKVVSYNIMSGRTNELVSRRSYDFSGEVIREIAPDIIGLNEVGRHATAGFPILEMEKEPAAYLGDKLGMYSYFACAKVFGGCGYGNALLSKYPIKSAKTVLIPDVEYDEEDEFADYYETRSILVAEVDVCGGIVVLVSHFGLMPQEKINAVNTALDIVKSTDKPVLLMGDFNMLADDETLAPIFDALHDTTNGEKEPHTWPSNPEKEVHSYEAKIKNIKGKEGSRKIDYIFTSKHFDTRKVEVFESVASDHKPYITYLTLKEDLL